MGSVGAKYIARRDLRRTARKKARGRTAPGRVFRNVSVTPPAPREDGGRARLPRSFRNDRRLSPT